MSSADLLVPPPDSEKDPRSDQQRELWTVTVDGLMGFLPGLVEDVFPPPAERSKEQVSDSAPSEQQQQQQQEKLNGDAPSASGTPKLEQGEAETGA